MNALDQLIKLDLAIEPVPMEEPEYHQIARAAADELSQLRADLEEETERNDLFGRCLDRALKIWQKAYPDKTFWPDGADNLAWVFDRLSQAEADNAVLSAAVKDAQVVIGAIPFESWSAAGKWMEKHGDLHDGPREPIPPQDANLIQNSDALYPESKGTSWDAPQDPPQEPGVSR
jgi:hypothetical protein